MFACLLCKTICSTQICQKCQELNIEDFVNQMEVKNSDKRSLFCVKNTSPDVWVKDIANLLSHEVHKCNYTSFSQQVSILGDYAQFRFLLLGRMMKEQRFAVGKKIKSSSQYANIHSTMKPNVDLLMMSNVELLKLKMTLFYQPTVPRQFSIGLVWGQQAQRLWSAAMDYYGQALSAHVSYSLCDIIYEYTPLCKCVCALLEENITSRPLLAIRCGCDFVICTDHLACSCCILQNCDTESCKTTMCELCSKICDKCLLKPRCHLICFQMCKECDEYMCKTCPNKKCDLCDYTIYCMACYEKNRCGVCKNAVCDNDAIICSVCGKATCPNCFYGCLKTTCFNCVKNCQLTKKVFASHSRVSEFCACDDALDTWLDTWCCNDCCNDICHRCNLVRLFDFPVLNRKRKFQ